ncbi:efflux RND transporter permease subunit [Gimesia maris]|uniref:efflux RND transporter permease subunit n=1 Tax=Gimesia maris TaxID=122 RepID=UPI00241DCCF0|nr:efflux RND transporter permease subunit [Gimesia maris]|tara:strand:+ start:130457 stop:133921 length:3465 start_codon:yes stop_codon:yes gene_type:complete
MFAKFLHRPALAIVISLLILFMGGLAIFGLPISQFPSVAPPSVVVAVSFPGSSAKILVDSTLVILERAINGVPNMRYMSSAATSAGEASIMIVFEPGTDPNVAVLNVNNRIQMVKNRLPPIVEREGIIVMQNMTSMLMYVNVYSKDPNHDQNFLYNYVSVNLLPEIQRIRGVGRATILGNRAYAMRVELNLERMRAYNISSADIMEAIKEQSIIGSPGRLGQATGTTSQTIEYVLTWVGRYNKPEQYEQIILRSNPNGEILRLSDVAKVSLGSSFYDLYSDIDGLPSASIVLKQTPGSNAAEVIEEVKKKLEEVKGESFPPGIDYAVSYDVSSFLDASIEKVLHTLFEAFILVSLVVYLFLGDFRSTLIPTLAVPVSLIGTFFFMSMFGMSINLITLFALVLAIGVVVDDAIVVVEAVHAKMHEKHLSPYAATREVVHEISGAIIAITLVMTSVFIPVTFMPGAVGVFYRQFALTMAMSIVLSGVVALTLTPVLCAMILKPHSNHEQQRGLIGFVNRVIRKSTGRYANVLRGLLSLALGLGAGYGIYELLHIEFVHELVSEQFHLTKTRTLVISGVMAVLFIFTFRSMFSGSEPGEKKKRGPLGIFLHLFDRGVEKVTGGFVAIVSRIVSRRLLTMLVIGGFGYGILLVNEVLPSGFIPLEDQGVIYGIIQTPPGSTLEYTNSKSHELQKICQEFEEVTSVTSLAGYEILTEGRGSNAGTCLINLKPWAERELTSKEIIAKLEEKGREISNVKLEFFEPPAVPGFGAAGGFSLCLLDKTNSGNYEEFGKVTENFMTALGKRKEMKGLFTFFANNYPQYEIIIDNDVAMQKGVSIADAMDNLSIVVGSTWEQGFIRFGQFYKVYVQSAPEFRRYPEDLENMFVKNDDGEMVPYSSFMKIKKTQGMNEINRYNLYTTAIIQGAPATGFSSGQAIDAIKEVAEQTLPHGYGIGWQGLAYDEANKGNTAIYIFAIVVIFVYLVLVGQYESFLLPLAVIASLPVGLFGSFLFLKAMGLANDVYCQIGLVMLVGLLGKNAILIIEFAVQRRQEGLSIKDAAIEGGNLRFRPIVMTSFAFIAGLIPLVRATGPGAIGNRTIGSTAVGGMLMGTLIGVLVIPGLYYLFGKMADGKKMIRDEHDEPLSELFERDSLAEVDHGA